LSTNTTTSNHPYSTRRHWVVAPDRLLKRGFPAESPRWLRVVGTALILAGAALIVATAAIHLHLWLAGYRHVPRIGPLFIAQAVTGFVLAPVLALGRHVIVVLGSAGFMAASAVGLLLSATVGFLGIHDDLGVPWATPSLAIELTGFVLLGIASVLLLVRRH
jgi:hypothetical protein